MGLDFEYIAGQTPLEEDESQGLRIKTSSTRWELDEFEQKNIEDCVQWIQGRTLKVEHVFSDVFIKEVHQRMYSGVWSWAGKYRLSDKNLGIDKWQIQQATRSLCDDAQFWIKEESYAKDEVAIRFKHAIVSIHCFPNGNGRHSRLIADIINENIFGNEPFTLGSLQINEDSDVRKEYLNALKQADRGNIKALLDFARS